MKEKLTPIEIWWRAFRYHFVPPSIFPATFGAIISWAVFKIFFPEYFLLVLVGIIVNHIGLNMIDDYFDYKHSVDSLKNEEKNPYSGGSGTLSAGLIKPVNMLKASIICFALTAVIGLYLTFERGLPILLFGFFGVFCAVFYTAPPISLSHHGFGEFAQLINFGITIGLGSYFVQTQSISLEALVATLPMGIMLFSMILINEIPDIKQDRMAGKFTLVVRYGVKKSLQIYIISWFLTYTVILLGVILEIIPWITLIALSSIPLVYKSMQILSSNVENPVMLAPANLYMIKAHSVTCLMLIGAYAIYGGLGGSDLPSLAIILLSLALVYIPAVSILLTNKQGN